MLILGNQIRQKRVQDVIWMVINVVWLHSLTQLGGKKSPPVYQKQTELYSLRLWVFLSFLFRHSLARPCGVFFRSPRSDPYQLFSIDFLFALVSAGTRSACGKQKNLQ